MLPDKVRAALIRDRLVGIQEVNMLFQVPTALPSCDARHNVRKARLNVAAEVRNSL